MHPPKGRPCAVDADSDLASSFLHTDVMGRQHMDSTSLSAISGDKVSTFQLVVMHGRTSAELLITFLMVR